MDTWIRWVGVGLAVGVLAAWTLSSVAGTSRIVRGRGAVNATLDGFQQAPTAIKTTGAGALSARVTRSGIEYTLSYRDLEGDVAAAAGAHIHFGRPGLSGGILVYLCEGAGLTAPTGTPPCVDDGSGSGTVSGIITAEDVLFIADQGVEGGDLKELWAIIANDASYVNLHTSVYPAGEIRGAITR